MTKRLNVYFHKTTGNILRLTEHQARKRLNDEWQQVQFVKNEKGEQVMRFQFDSATVDVSENGVREVLPSGHADAS